MNGIKSSDYHHSLMEWVKAHKPDDSTAESTAEEFISRANIQGSDKFIQKMKKVIKKTAYLATGITLLQRMLERTEEIVIEEDENRNCYYGGGSLCLSFFKNVSYVISRSVDGKRELTKNSRVAGFIHECLHKWHFNTNEQECNARRRKKSLSSEMDDQEEELTITGTIKGSSLEEPIDFCSENSARIELGRPERINHCGAPIPKNTSPTFFHMVSNRIIESIKKELTEHAESIDKDQTVSGLHGQTLLDYVMCNKLLEKDLDIQKEWSEIALLLIGGGFKPKDGFKMAVLDDSLEIVEKLIEAGIKPPNDIILDLIVGEEIIKELLNKAGYIPANNFLKLEIELSLEEKYPLSAKVSLEMLRLLISLGAEFSEVAISRVIRRNSFKIVSLILELGIKSPKEMLHLAVDAADTGDLRMIKFLISQGAEADEYCLKSVIETNIKKLIIFFLEAGVKPSQDALALADREETLELLKSYQQA